MVGKAATGKDFLRGAIGDKIPFRPMYTTRPMRDGETDGKDYRFVTSERFSRMEADGEFLTVSEYYGEWKYGTSRRSWSHGGLFFLQPNDIRQLPPEERSACLVILLDSSDDVRRARLSTRMDVNDSVDRRMASDADTFAGFVDYDLVLRDWGQE